MKIEFGYEYDATIDDVVWQRTQGKVSYEVYKGAFCLRSGRDALKLIAREYKPCKVFMPALSCHSMFQPFEIYNHKIVFYKLSDHFSADLSDIEYYFGDGGIFVYMNYFGNISMLEEQLFSLQEKFPKLVIVKDSTHTFFDNNNSLFAPDYEVVSIRKWINIPDGGLLWSKKEHTFSELGEDTRFSELRLKAQHMKFEYHRTGKEELKDDYRRIFSSITDMIDMDPLPHRMSAYSYEILKNIDLEEIKNCRITNATLLKSYLIKNGIKIINSDYSDSALYVAFFVENRDHIQRFLANKGIYNTIIWPISNSQEAACSVAKVTSDSMLAAPCDQRYNLMDMKIIAIELINCINDSFEV